MLSQMFSGFRQLSAALLFAGLLGGCYCEAQSDVKVGRDGRPKGPLWQQRLTYLALIGVALPGMAWGTARAFRNEQKTPWE